jgi:hypothetical protein
MHLDTIKKFRSKVKDSTIEENIWLLTELYACNKKVYSNRVSIYELSLIFQCSEDIIVNQLKSLDIYEKRRCSSDCKEWKLITSFGKRANGYFHGYCKECHSKKNLENHYKKHDSRMEWQRKYDKKRMPEKIEYSKKYNKDRRKNDPSFKIKGVISAAIYRLLQTKKDGNVTLDILKYPISDLITHLESQFVEGMDWNNHGSEWQLDHIRPISSFNITSIECEDFKKCWALSNLQPLWTDLNQIKKAQWDGTETNTSVRLKYQNDDRYHLVDELEIDQIIDEILAVS